MKVELFVKTLDDGTTQDTWVTERKDGKGEVISQALRCEETTLNPITGFLQEEKFMFWVKGSTLAVVSTGIKTVLAQIKQGMLVPYRVFSETPMHPTHQPDVNPSTMEPMDRYSQVRLGVPKVARELHRTYIEVPVADEPSAETTKAEEPKVETGAETA